MSPPTVTLRYRCGTEAFEGVGLSHGLAIGPVPGGRLCVSSFGTPAQILELTLAAIDNARSWGLEGALKLCVERGVGLNQVREVLGEQWFEMGGEAP